jgi:hypothetical protein
MNKEHRKQQLKENREARKGLALRHEQQAQKSARLDALELFQSPRGRYIVGQALYIASEKLKDSEPSNATDMRMLGEKLFGIGWHIESTKKVIPSLVRKAVANAR